MTRGETISRSEIIQRLETGFKGTLHFIIYDHFGLDKPDIEKFSSGIVFRSWFMLQHWKKFNGKYRPFVTIMEFDIPFETYL